MPSGVYKHNPISEETKQKMSRVHIKQFCKGGHDTFVVGRSKSHNCVACTIERRTDLQKDVQANESFKQKRRVYLRQKRKTDPVHRLAVIVRHRTSMILKQKSLNKKSKLSQYLGCTVPELKIYLENQFLPGMTWNNHGPCRGDGPITWNVDHVVALGLCNIYNLDKTLNIELSSTRLYELCHYTNLQPLWAKHNIQKGNKLTSFFSS